MAAIKMATRKLSFVLDAPTKSIQLPASDFLRGVTAARVRSLSYENSAGGKVLAVSVAQLDQGSHTLANGDFQRRTTVMFLGPLASTTATLNATPGAWDAYFSDQPTEVSRLDVTLYIDGAPGNTNINATTPVLLELEIQLTARA